MTDRADAILAPGLRLDRYELLCPLAKGGMAEVWAGRQYGKHGFQRLVAIKTILSAHAADQRARRMFLEEGRLAASIRHPNVAAIHDLGDERDLLFLVLEYVEGDSLSQLERAARDKGKRIPLGVALRIVSDACQALHAAHELRGPDGSVTTVVQRDVSPQNVLLSVDGAVKVIDFGIAKILNQVRQETSAGLVKGKLQYMAPEQALGREIDRRADIWGAGATLYHLLAGRPPFTGANELETLHILTSGRAPEPPAGVPEEVRAIVMRALEYEPEDRFATAEEMHHALERAIHRLCGVVTSADVAKVVNEYLCERIERRRNMVQKAVTAADDRARLAAEFDRAAASNEAQSNPLPVAKASAAPTAIVRRTPRSLPPSRRRVGPVGIGVSLGVVLFFGLLALFGLTRKSEGGVEPVAAPPLQPAAVDEAPPAAPEVATSEPEPESEPEVEPEAKPVAPAPRPATKPRASKQRTPLDVVTSRK